MSRVEVREPAVPIAEPHHLSPADYMRLARRLATDFDSALEPLAVGFLSSSTLEPVEPFFAVEAARLGFQLRSYFGAFNQFEQEVAADSHLRAFDPDVVVIAMRCEDIDPDAVVRFHACKGARYKQLADDLIDRIAGTVEALRGWSTAQVLVANLALPARLPFGLLDANLHDSVAEAVHAANSRLRQRLRGASGVTIWDYASLVREQGTREWSDERLWALARIPVAASRQPALARHLTRTIRAVLTAPAKCLVLDLDDTLWGGVVGEDGIEGIQLGDDHPGFVYKSFQRAVLSLRDRGILLAIVSKNDMDLVDRVVREHPEMLVRWEHIAASRIGWEPKSRMIRDIAAELKLGPDSMVLFDDNPVERAEVQANAPEVRVIEVPPEPWRYAESLWECPWFDQIALSQEDRARPQMYRAEQARRTYAGSCVSVEQFLSGLEMVVSTGHANRASLGRIAQLVNKTNQFNLTTRRRSLTELTALSEDPEWRVRWVRVRDRFGDHGMVGVGILRREQERGVVDTLLLSCRILNRRVEEALLAALAEDARRLGCTQLIGEYRPTKRNTPTRGLYPRFGFEPEADSRDDCVRYALDLATQTIEWPGIITRE